MKGQIAIAKYSSTDTGLVDYGGHNPFHVKHVTAHLQQVTFARVLGLSHGYKCSFCVVNTSHRNVRHVTKHLLQLIFCNRSFIIVHFLKHSSAHLLNGAKFISM